MGAPRGWSPATVGGLMGLATVLVLLLLSPMWILLVGDEHGSDGDSDPMAAQDAGGVAEEDAGLHVIASRQDAGGGLGMTGAGAGGGDAGLGVPSRESYIEATVALGCMELDPDLEQKASRRRKALARYGFTEGSYAAAQDRFRDDPALRALLKDRVTEEACGR